MTIGMQLFVKFVLLVCFGGLLVRCGPPENDIASLCGGSLTVWTAGILRADSMWLRAGHTCSLRVYSSFHADEEQDKLRVEVLSLEAPCGVGSLQFFDGDDAEAGHALSGRLCGDISFQHTMFLSSEKNYITVDIHRYTDGPVSLRLLATATSFQYMASDFICDNLWDVDSSLQCDGYNNCGDWSDERNYLCSDILSTHWQMILAIGASSVVFFAAVFVILLIRKHRHRRLLNRNRAVVPASRGLVQTVPDYGSTREQTSIHPTAFLPAPPPYSPPQTTVPRVPPPPYTPSTPSSQPAEAASASSASSGTATETATTSSISTTTTTNTTPSITSSAKIH